MSNATNILLDITHKVNGMLETGGYCDRRVMVRRESIGMPAHARLDDVINEHGTTWRELAYDYARQTGWRGDKVIRRGVIVR